MSFRHALRVFVMAAAAVSAFAQDSGNNVCDQVPAIARTLTEITGFPLKHPVPCEYISKGDVNQFLKKRVKEVASPEEIRAEELTLKKFGLVPQDFDLAKSTVDLLTEQAAAFYDFDRKKLFITETTSGESQEPVLAHELSHALADQSFNLGKYTRQGRNSDDGSTARLAVMEGQATWLMTEYMARQTGTTLVGHPEMAQTMAGMSESEGGSQFPVFDNAPLYLRLSLVFPYTKGMMFQNALVEREGKEAFTEPFRRPPVSTQQILHPEKYEEAERPIEPPLPDAHLPHGYKGLVGGMMGELEHHILLEQYLGKEQERAIAPHWRGSVFELRENKKEGRVVLLYAAEWDSEEIARRYFTAYQEVLRKKWKQMKVTAETDTSVSGTGDDGRFVLERRGRVVTSMEGLAPELH
ncbi:MAG TPA: hypothetical protein VKB88_06705 [Bryobacteraceae bacterium]|nr:hypothetical protein [Bryobacteraceae bacterium]